MANSSCAPVLMLSTAILNKNNAKHGRRERFENETGINGCSVIYIFAIREDHTSYEVVTTSNIQ